MDQAAQDGPKILPMKRSDAPAALDPTFVQSEPAFDALLERLKGAARYAIDTEFSRERTYYPALGLVQIAVGGEIYLVDPLKVDVRGLAEIFRGDAEMIVHAGTQDFEIFATIVGALPSRVFDTQLAGAFIGHGLASLGKLVFERLGVQLAKGAQLSDWSRRPLSKDALNYAAHDVLHLEALRDDLARELEARGRLEWALELCRSQLEKSYGPPRPEEAWWKLKGRTRLRRRAAKVAQVLAAERELRARELDTPVRRVLADLPLMAMAESPPRTVEDLARVRGLDHSRSHGTDAKRLLTWVERGLALPDEALVLPESKPDEGAPQPLVSLCLAWVAHIAERERIEPSVLATRADVTAFLSSPRAGRLTHGFRHELVGRDLEELASGDAAVGFVDGDLHLFRNEHG
jgi:ribonuclease D